MLNSILEVVPMIYNFTPHDIIILSGSEFIPELRKYIRVENTVEVKRIPSSGMLSAHITTENADPIDGVPTFSKAVSDVDKIPDYVTSDDVLIVSAMYATAYHRIYGFDSRLYTVSDPVYCRDDDCLLKIVGCRGICESI
jgi:hypothetical protein